MTSKQITLGNVATVTGPVPGLFQGAQVGLEAYIAYQNSIGGVNGRQLAMKTGDDALNCNQEQTETQRLLPDVFAFVGSFSVNDNCAATVFTANPNVPNVSYALTPQANDLPSNFSIEPRPPGFRTGPFKFYKEKMGVSVVGAITPTSAQDAWNQEQAAMESVGYTIGYHRLYQPTETDFTADVIRMKQAKVDFLWLSDNDPATMGRIMGALAQQNYRPKVIMTAGTAYNGTFFKQVPPALAEGMYTDQQYALFLDDAGTDKGKVPEVDLFLEWMKKTKPNFAPDLFAVFAWASARLFVQALQAAGKNPTQQSVMAELQKIHTFDSNGLVAKADPASKVPPECWIMVQAKAGSWLRVTPGSGFQCDPGGYFLVKK